MRLMLAAVLSCLLGPAAFGAPCADECPRVTVSCPEMATPGLPVTFTANIYGGDTAVNYTFRWVVSAGVIASGQDTSTITLDTTGVREEAVEATVEVGGLPGPCARKASCAARFPPACIVTQKVDEYGDVAVGDEKARLDNFAVELQNDPTAVGYIVVYAGRRSRPGLAGERAKRARNFLVVSRGVKPGRLVWLDGGYREDLTTELFVMPAGSPAPALTPTVDPSEVKRSRAAARKKRKRRASRKREG